MGTAGGTGSSTGSLTSCETGTGIARPAPTRVFVGGGTISGATVGLLEWLTPDARSLTFVQGGLVLAESHSFAAMPGGGVLGVGVCVPKSVQICSGDVPKRSVVWLRKSGAIDLLPPLDGTLRGAR